MARTKNTSGSEKLLKSMSENSEEVTRPYVDIKAMTSESDLDEVDESADDVELDNLDDEGESDPDKTTELDLKAKPSARRKPAAPKPRSRKRKEPVVVDEEITAVIEPEIVVAPKKEKKPEPVAQKPARVEPVTEEVPPVTSVVTSPVSRKATPHQEPDHLREDVSIATATLHKTMDSMVHQWGSVKEISSSICHELERVNTMLKTPAVQAEPADIKEYLKQAAPRITLANKIALGVSAAAVVFSVISLSLASSTRHTLLQQSGISARVVPERRHEPVAPPPVKVVVAPKPVPVATPLSTPLATPLAAPLMAPVAKAYVVPPPVRANAPSKEALAKAKAAAMLARIPILTAPKSYRKPVFALKERRIRTRARQAR